MGMLPLFNLILVVIGVTNVANAQQWQQPSSYQYYRQEEPTECSRATCRLPECFCAGKKAPRNMDPSVIPQIVMFSFDDAVNEEVFDYYLELFPKERINPNGCPVSVTFFVSHNWTDYDMVKQLYDRGHEIASHSITHRMPQSWWRYGPAEDWETEIQGQRENIAIKASIPITEIRGMRAPFLDTGGDEQYKMLEKHDFEYDASYMTGPYEKGGAWPFTLDFVPSWEYCTNLNCPKDKHPGVWEVPLNRWIGVDGAGCSMVDGCQQQPSHKGEALTFLWQNFNRHYYGNRAPLGVSLHATWFKTSYHYDAMKEFVKTISEMSDVYLVNIHQTLEYIRNPQTIDRVSNFEPWLKTCTEVTGNYAENAIQVNTIAQNSENFKEDLNNKDLSYEVESKEIVNDIHSDALDKMKNEFAEYESNSDRMPSHMGNARNVKPVQLRNNFVNERYMPSLDVQDYFQGDLYNNNAPLGLVDTNELSNQAPNNPLYGRPNFLEESAGQRASFFPDYNTVKETIIPQPNSPLNSESEIQEEYEVIKKESVSNTNFDIEKFQRIEAIQSNIIKANPIMSVSEDKLNNDFEAKTDPINPTKTTKYNQDNVIIKKNGNTNKAISPSSRPQNTNRNPSFKPENMNRNTPRKALEPSPSLKPANVRPRFRPNRPQRTSIQNRANLQRNVKSSANEKNINFILTSSGTIAVYYLYSNIAWL